jgi:hypothetical protein
VVYWDDEQNKLGTLENKTEVIFFPLGKIASKSFTKEWIQ